MQTKALPLEIKNLSEAGEITGLAAAFGNVDHGGDRIMPGAFAATLAEHKAAGTAPAMLLHHKLDRPCGVWTELSETSDGLMAKGKFTLDASDGREAYSLARDGALRGLSVGFQVDDAVAGTDARELKRLSLFEVSLVTVPMNNRARLATVKSIDGVRDIETLLKSHGLSNREAKAAASAAWKSISAPENTDEEAAIAAILTAATNRLRA